jgi:3',5'-cyclic-AMP phosphodiesterase
MRFLLAQISDTHIRADDGGALARLRQALAQARRADAIVLTGDLANDGRAEEYGVLAEALADVPTPLFLMPGNHDDRARLAAAFPGHAYLPAQGPMSFSVEQFPLRLVAIDQTAPGHTHGEFTRACADWLERTLAAAPDKPTILALHHPPFPTHDLLFDGIGLRRADLLAHVVARHRQVLRVICGHHHRVVFGQIAHAPVVVAPSTSWVYGLALREGDQLAPRSTEQPGWMLHAWTARSGLASHFMGL